MGPPASGLQEADPTPTCSSTLILSLPLLLAIFLPLLELVLHGGQSTRFLWHSQDLGGCLASRRLTTGLLCNSDF